MPKTDKSRHGVTNTLSASLGSLAALWLLPILAFAEPETPSQATAPPRPQTGEASFYGKEFSGQKTASGEPFDPNKLTAASPTLPLGTKAKVINKENGRSVKVTVTDRGPNVDGRILDVSQRAAEHLDMKDDGVVKVKVVPTEAPK